MIYDKVWYPGPIIGIENDQLVTSFLKRNKKSFAWPQPPEEEKLFPTQILCKIDPPPKSRKRFQKEYFNIAEVQMQNFDELTSKCIIYEDS